MGRLGYRSKTEQSSKHHHTSAQRVLEAWEPENHRRHRDETCSSM
ncbi:hypothetical protein HanPI659440_Chr05g0200121 [Helianthus annuus]|nr:hypothetical protein HanPI659440_Chr05g0200121 [Helianthus annuus]